MNRCETSRLVAIACLVSCALQKILHGDVKTIGLILKMMGGRAHIKVVKILQALAIQNPKPIPNIKEKDGQTYLNKQKNYR